MKILTGPIEAGLYAKDVPRERWRDLVREWRGFCQIHLLHDCRELLRFVTEARTHRMWEALGLADEEDFVRRGLALDPVEVQWALEGLRRRKPDEAVSLVQAITLGKQGHPTKDAKPYDIRLANYGTRAVYLRARLARDHPAILAALNRGKYRSVRAAAIAAGIIRPASALDLLRRAWRRATPAERQTFRKEIAP